MMLQYVSSAVYLCILIQTSQKNYQVHFQPRVQASTAREADGRRREEAQEEGGDNIIMCREQIGGNELQVLLLEIAFSIHSQDS